MPCLCSGKAGDVVVDNRGPRRRRNSIALTEQEDDHSHPYIHEVKFKAKSSMIYEESEGQQSKGSRGDNGADDDSQISSLSFESASNPPAIGLVDLGTPKRNTPQAQNISHLPEGKEKKKLLNPLNLFGFLNFSVSSGQRTDISSPMENESIRKSPKATKVNQGDSEEYSA